MTAPHLLLVAAFFPPSRGSGVYRAVGIANAFVARGWDVTVLTVDAAFFDDVTGSSDERLLEMVDERVKIERVFAPRTRLVADIRAMSERRAAYPRVAAAVTLVRQRAGFPDKYADWIAPAVKRAKELHRAHPVGVSLATGNPWSAFEVARQLHSGTGVPYIMDYRDSWTLNQFTESPAFGERSPQVRWERKLMDQAAAVVHVNEPMREWHGDRYPQDAAKMTVIENGVDRDVIGDIAFRQPSPDAPLRFGYLGTITGQLPHEATWEGWERARRRPELKDATFSLYGHMGFFSHDVAAITALIPPPSHGVIIEGSVSKPDVAKAYGSLDVVVMMIPSSRFVTAGKTYESMATGKVLVPIHDPGTAASEPMRGYPLKFPVSDVSPEAVEASFVAAARAARVYAREQYDEAIAYASRYERSRLLEPLIETAERLAHGATS